PTVPRFVRNRERFPAPTRAFGESPGLPDEPRGPIRRGPLASPRMEQHRTELPNARVTPRFAGISTFCRFPRLDDALRAGKPVDWALYGAPFDSGVTFRPGARFGPRAIRAASQYAKPYHLEHDVNIAEVLSMADAGDSPVQPYDCEENAKVIASFATALATPTTKLFAVGGDHSIALANMRA